MVGVCSSSLQRQDEKVIDPQPIGLTLHEIESVCDDYYHEWLDLYQQAFSLQEQVLVSTLNRSLCDGRKGSDRIEIFYAALDEDGRFVGMAQCELAVTCRAAALWYFAISPERRGKGVGTAFYRLLLETLTTRARIDALVFEVESPFHVEDAARESIAKRRIEFYQRSGAKQLIGIDYVQSVGWQPEVQMGVMVHLFGVRTAISAFNLAHCVLGGKLIKTGPLGLE